MTGKRVKLLTALLVTVVWCEMTNATPMGTNFTYQGQLKNGGLPVSDTCDFEFRLWDAITSGNQQGTTVTATAVSVSNGLFNADLDFGVAVFNGETRWLEVAVRCPMGTGSYTSLNPREPITAAPYSLQTRGIYTNGSGNVGIGTMSPAAKLEVYATGQQAVRGTGNWVGVHGTHEGGGTFPGVWGETNSTSIGASAVRGDANATSGGSYGVFGKCNSASGIGVFGENTSGGTAIVGLGNGSFREQATLRVENIQPNAGMAAYVKSQGSWATMHVENDSSGEVLWLQRNDSSAPFIVARNATTGQDVFRVSGSGYTKVSVLQITGGADLAEGFDISPLNTVDGDGTERFRVTPRPGMVVSIDPDHPGQLLLSHKPYDTTVAGIVSGAGGVQTGMLLHHSGTIANGKFPVALSGRVYCFCDTSNGRIRPGDLLTTSSHGGYAMKVTDRDRAAGAIIGKAMTGLETGENGLVLVLVTLQ